MDSTKVALKDIVQCSVCLDPFTRPKALPCQHTFCYSCLLTLCSGGKSITCPQCRQVHQVPENGVQAFYDNIIVNNLLSLAAVTDCGFCSKEVFPCCDCRKTSAASTCDHCNQNLCPSCLVTHAKLTTQIENNLSELRELMMSKENQDSMRTNRVKLLESLENIKLEKEKTEAEFDELEKQLRKKRKDFKKYISMMEGLHKDLMLADDEDRTNKKTDSMTKGKTGSKDEPRGTPITSWTASSVERYSSLLDCKTCSSLEIRSHRTRDMRIAARQITRGEFKLKSSRESTALETERRQEKTPTLLQEAESQTDRQLGPCLCQLYQHFGYLPPHGLAFAACQRSGMCNRP